MKIVLDLQGAQSNSRHRGIGRYTLSAAKAFAEVAAGHELWLALNGLHASAAIDLAKQFDALVPRERILVNELSPHIAGCFSDNRQRIRVAEAAQATFFEQLHADCIWHSSMFEGWGDDSVVTLGTGVNDRSHAATLYDLIPLLHPERYLTDALYRSWYYRRLGLLKRCGLLLAISDSSRQEAIERLDMDPSHVAVVPAAADAVFKRIPANEMDWARWQNRAFFYTQVGTTRTRMSTACWSRMPTCRWRSNSDIFWCLPAVARRKRNDSCVCRHVNMD
jgi:hypothetical protein